MLQASRHTNQAIQRALQALVLAGGFTFEDQIFKGLSLGAPSAKMVGKTIGRAMEDHELPVYVERFASTKDEIFVTAAELRRDT